MNSWIGFSGTDFERCGVTISTEKFRKFARRMLRANPERMSSLDMDICKDGAYTEDHREILSLKDFLYGHVRSALRAEQLDLDYRLKMEVYKLMNSKEFRNSAKDLLTKQKKLHLNDTYCDECEQWS